MPFFENNTQSQSDHLIQIFPLKEGDLNACRTTNWYCGAIPLHVLALTTTFLTFLLLCSGGLVTSKGVGMSVPDWPTTYGYNMFLFPMSRWVGGIFYEHSHRLLASGVGFMTLILAGLTFIVEKRRWVRWMALAAVIGVIAQGVLGGLRVTLYKDEIGIFHAILAQSFFALLVIFSAVTSRRFCEGAWFSDSQVASLRWLALAAVILTYGQLAVAATIRHAHLGLAIPDFPTAYGHLLPDISDKTIAVINADRLSHTMMPTTATQVCLQMIHRGGAVLLFGVVLLLIIRSHKLFPLRHWTRSWSLLWGTLLLCQIMLGAWTIWSNKAADVATAHMAFGALMLGIAVLFTFRTFCGNQQRINRDGKDERDSRKEY
ncbi:MAG TPA: COX15/CtaA family protein [Chthoniobacterales bacterium]|nr:COX15/CtaA family protein [Chthoniobacterales bacterium]